MVRKRQVAVERILYADESVAVVVKRAGEVCEFSVTGDAACAGTDKSGRISGCRTAGMGTVSLPGIIRPELETYTGRPVDFCASVHRLDCPVTGICVMALDRTAAARLSASFASGLVQKNYLAVTEKNAGISIPVAGCNDWVRLSGAIRFNRSRQKARIVPPDTPGAKSAVLQFRILGTGERYHFVEVQPFTGRTHQIRCQLASASMCIKGDVKYGARRPEPSGGIRLHAYCISFPHPRDGRRLEFSALPPEMDRLWTDCVGCLKNTGFVPQLSVTGADR